MHWKSDHEKWAQRGRDFLERQKCVVSFWTDGGILCKMTWSRYKWWVVPWRQRRSHIALLCCPLSIDSISFFEMLCMYQQTWEVKTASCTTNPTHSLTFGWVHTLHDSGLIIMITLFGHIGKPFLPISSNYSMTIFPKQIHTLIVLFHTVDGSEILHHLGCTIPCKLWDIYPISTDFSRIFSINRISMSLHRRSRIWHPWRSFWTKKPGWMRFLKMRCRGAEMRSWNSGTHNFSFLLAGNQYGKVKMVRWWVSMMP